MGSPIIGNTLFLVNFDFEGNPTPSIAYQWLNDGVEISGEVGTTYEVQNSDLDALLSLRITISNPYATVVKTIGFDGSNEGVEEIPDLPSISTKKAELSSVIYPFRVGVPVTLSGGDVTSSVPATVGYVWKVDGVTVATQPNDVSYTPVTADAGKVLTVTITATNSTGSVSTTIGDSSPIESEIVGLTGSFASVTTPIFPGQVATQTNDIVNADSIAYSWEASNTGGTTAAGTSETFTVPAGYGGGTLSVQLTATAIGFSDIVLNSSDANISVPVDPVQGSTGQSSVLIPGPTGYGVSFGNEWHPTGDVQYTGTSDFFGRDSSAIFCMGLPRNYIMDGGFTLDMYAFHCTGISHVEVSADGGTGISAGFVQEGPYEGEGYYTAYVDPTHFPAGATYEIRATAYPVNGYTRSARLKLLNPDGSENKVQINTSSTICSAYDQVMAGYTHLGRNIVELTESGYYIPGTANSTVGNYRDYDFGQGWVQIQPASGVLPKINLRELPEDETTFGIRMNIQNYWWKNTLFENKVPTDSSIWGTDTDLRRDGLNIPSRVNALFWFDGCTFESNLTDVGANLVDCDFTPKFPGFVKSKYRHKIFGTDCHWKQSLDGPNGAGWVIVKRCTADSIMRDVNKNAHFVINSGPMKIINSGCSNLHADHFQLYENNINDPLGDVNDVGIENLVENRIMYNYKGEDTGDKMSQPIFLTHGPTTLKDIAIVHNNWYGASDGFAKAQMGENVFENYVLIGNTFENRKAIIKGNDADEDDIGGTGSLDNGPLLLRGNITKTFKHLDKHELDNIVAGVTKGCLDENNFPDVEYTGLPQSDSNLSTVLTWFVSNTSNVTDNTIRVVSGSEDTNLTLGATCTGVSGTVNSSDVFGSATGRVGSLRSDSDGIYKSCTIEFNTEAQRDAFIGQKQYIRISTSKGSASSSFPASKSSSPKNAQVTGLLDKVFSGVTLSQSDIKNSTSGLTLEFRVDTIRTDGTYPKGS
jgi:hypothetical protein